MSHRIDESSNRVGHLRKHSFFRRGGGPEEFRGWSLTFCLPKKPEGQHKFDTTKRGSL